MSSQFVEKREEWAKPPTLPKGDWAKPPNLQARCSIEHPLLLPNKALKERNPRSPGHSSLFSESPSVFVDGF